MILEEIEEEIDQRTNKLAIEYLASLLVDGPAWDEMIKDCDPDILYSVKLYVEKLRQYVKDKISYSKAKRFANSYFPHFPEDFSHYKGLVEAERNLDVSKYNKNLTRERLISLDVDYKKYHKHLR